MWAAALLSPTLFGLLLPTTARPTTLAGVEGESDMRITTTAV
jgi:hypothetical protein